MKRKITVRLCLVFTLILQFLLMAALYWKNDISESVLRIVTYFPATTAVMIVVIWKLHEHTSIHTLVDSLWASTDKMSMIFDTTAVQIGVFEYNDRMKQVRATKRMASLCLLTPADMEKYLEDKAEFQKLLKEMKVGELKEHPEVYQPFPELEYYLRIQIFSENGEVLGIITDVTEEILRWQQIKYDRDNDILTGLLNRRGFYLQMDSLFEEKEKLGNAIMMMVDLNQLKYVNDTYGHASGDMAIKAAADILKHCPAPHKAVARLGGDEFAMFLYGEEQGVLLSHINHVHEEMMNTKIVVYDETELPIRFAAGYICYPEYDISSSKMLHCADKAMYCSKRRGESRFVAYDSSMADVR